MKEGKLTYINGKVFPYDEYECAVYGYDNKYAASCRYAVGGVNPTKTNKENPNDKYELRVSGMIAEPRHVIDEAAVSDIPRLMDPLVQQEYHELIHKIEEIGLLSKFNKNKGTFECLNLTEIKQILIILREMPVHQSVFKLSDKFSYLIKREYKELYFGEKNSIENNYDKKTIESPEI